MALWLESQQGLLNADYIAKVLKPERVSARQPGVQNIGDWQVNLVSGSGDIYRQSFDTQEKADACFRHYLNVLTSYQG